MIIFTSDKDGRYQSWWRNFLNSTEAFSLKFKSVDEVTEHVNLKLNKYSIRLTEMEELSLSYAIEGEEKDVTFFLLKWS